MITQGEDVEINALRKRGWSYVSDRPPHRKRLADSQGLFGRQEGTGCTPAAPARPLERFVPYLAARFADDPHVWASALYDEVSELGYACSYPSFARQLRLAGLRPHCEACSGVAGRDTIEIEHPRR